MAIAIETETFADLHVHLADRSVDDVLTEAQHNNVKVLGLLDRGSIINTEGLQGAIIEGQTRGITVIPGVECLTQVKIGQETIIFELLGLGFDIFHPEIQRVFDKDNSTDLIKIGNKIQFQREILVSLGFNMAENENNHQLYEEIRDPSVVETAIRYCRIITSNPTNLAYLESPFWQEKIAKQFEERPEDQAQLDKALYWLIFAKRNQPGYWFNQPLLDNLVTPIHAAGGIAIASTIREITKHNPNANIHLPDFLEYIFKNHNVDGVEVWDGGTMDWEMAKIARKAKKLALGGSGTDRSNHKYTNRVIGRGEELEQKMRIPARILEQIQKYQEGINS